MSSFLLYIFIILFIANFVGLFIAIVFGGTESFKAIDERIAKWIRGERSE